MPLLRPCPRLAHPVWAGATLASRYGKGADPQARIGESWEVWRDNALPDGRRQGEVVELPLLVKLVDVRERLSVQVHPDDAAALRFEGAPNGKSEGWVVLAAEPGAQVACGLVREMSRDELRERAISGAIEADLAWQEARPGDVVDVPAGTVHTIGGGVLLYEVQQPSDLTWRLYDWGRGRPLHLDRALEVARRGPAEPVRTPRPLAVGREEVLAGPWFTVERWIDATFSRELEAWEALTVASGEATVDGERVVEGSTVLVPPGGHAVEVRGMALAARVAQAGVRRL